MAYSAAAVADDLALDRLLVGLGRFLKLGALLIDVVLVAVAGQRALELPNPAPHRTTQLGQLLGPEDDQGDDEDDRQLQWSDIRHRVKGTGVSRRACELPEVEVEAAGRGLRLALVL